MSELPSQKETERLMDAIAQHVEECFVDTENRLRDSEGRLCVFYPDAKIPWKE